MVPAPDVPHPRAMDDPNRAPDPEIEPWVTDGPIEVDTGSPQDVGDAEAEVDDQVDAGA
jgi:hypothetical protein